MKIALIGRPNCGKSTLFNQVAGYRAETGNFHGTTVTFTESRVRVGGQVVELVDLPGTYTLEGTNPAEREARRYLASHEVDVILNVLDATRLQQSLELTLELLALGKPLVAAINVMDEAQRMGLKIDGPGLEAALGVPVLPLIASKGRGVRRVFLAALEAGRRGTPPPRPAAAETAEARHRLAGELVRRYTRQGERHLTWRDRLDDVLMHPVWGYVMLLLILGAFFQLVYGVGQLLEPPLLAAFEQFSLWLQARLGLSGVWQALAVGVIQGVSGGVAIVLPYLAPFLLGLGLLEDWGYLPRVAFLMDSFMHRIGLHGKAIVPFILGYGCNVPAVMSTRTLEEPRERFLAAALSTLVPCAARLSVVFGLVAFYLGAYAALGLYLFNLLVIALVGRILVHLLPEDSPGLILEMPPYRVPTLQTVLGKAWFRVREFVVEAWPLLIAGSAALALLHYWGLDNAFNWLVRPFTWAMGLPAETGVPLLFGVLRKELSLVMLGQALGTMDFGAVMSPVQLFVYTVFVVFYVPCVATLAALRRELGTRDMLRVTLLTVVVALVTAVLTRVVLSLV